jgi:hypothetical protein
MNNEYILVPWPDSQEYMEYPWFREEAILDIAQGSTYFIPKNRILEVADPDGIIQEVQESLTWAMSIYDLNNLINDTDITDEQKQWAKEKLTIKIDLL